MPQQGGAELDAGVAEPELASAEFDITRDSRHERMFAGVCGGSGLHDTNLADTAVGSCGTPTELLEVSLTVREPS
jgi:hypothetical protein